MEAIELRKHLLRTINAADDRLLNVVNAVIESYKDNEIVAFSVEGEPLTRNAYRKELREAEEQVLRGEYLSQKELEQEVKNW